MQRLLILHLDDEDVDVLARVAGLDPRPEVVLVHPNPSTMVRHLADLAELPITHEPPQPRAGDVVVASLRNGGVPAPWVEAFRTAGARIVSPEELGRSEVSDAPAAPAEPGKARVPEPRSVESLEAAPAPAPSPPPEIWTDPAATFTYLVRAAGGEDAAVTVWWDGDAGIWVPLLTTEASPAPPESATPRGRTLSTEYGKLVLTGGPAPDLRAVTRVVEDVVLRDLAAWRKTARALAGHGLPSGKGGAEAARAWALPVLDALRAASALLWWGKEGEWHLLLTRGNEIRLSGELVLSEAAFESGFGALGDRWRSWEPAAGLRLQLAPAAGDRALPLRLHRVDRALRGEAGA